jgi:uncharacterized membrane protein YphA (DoxX/SURF4 family)/predicted ester cyclase
LFAQFVFSAIENVQSSAAEHESRLQSWALTLVRIYVGLMFVPHVGGHLFGGPAQFSIYTQYFAALGMPFPSAALGLASVTEFISALGLVFGLCTRPVAFLSATYLLDSTWLGGHFTIDYVWVLPDGGYEFGVFWAIIIAVFTVVGGGRLSVDKCRTAKQFPKSVAAAQASEGFLAAVPDLNVAVVQRLLDGDRIVSHLRFTGHFTGSFMGHKGNGQPVDFIATDIVRVRHGRITDNWHLEDNLTFVQQIGVVTQ